MGQHKRNETSLKAKRGEIEPKVKTEREPSKREAAFLALWAKAVANRPAPLPKSKRNDREARRRKDREHRAHLRQINALALKAIRARQKAARKAKSA